MIVNSANKADHMPVLTATTVRRCNMCAVLAKTVDVRSRMSKNTKNMAIRISTPAATERVTVIGSVSDLSLSIVMTTELKPFE